MSFGDFTGGAAKRLDDVDLPRLGHRIGVGEDQLHALIDVESRGRGFDSKGRPLILFEPHVFYRCLGPGKQRDRAVRAGLAYKKWGTRRYPKDSYPSLLRAMVINETAALKACSWGMFQILGENHKMIGYNTVQRMVKAFMADEENHLNGAIEYLIAADIDDDLRRVTTDPASWVPVVRVWNGPGYRKNRYHIKAANAFKKWKGIRDTPWQPGQVDEGPPLSIQDPDPEGLPDVEETPPPKKGRAGLIAALSALAGAAVARFWEDIQGAWLSIPFIGG